MKIFNTWSTSEIKIQDPGLKDYITLKPLLVPRTSGRNTEVQFHKSNTHIVERLINRLMVAGHQGKAHKRTSGHNTGKAISTYKLVLDTFKIIEKETTKNPVEVLVKAIENAAPREEITTIEYGGAVYPKSVDCSPQRRIDIALKNMIQGAYSSSFNKKTSASRALAAEIINAYNMNIKSNAISKKFELERQADSSR